jgi:RNA 3'-terminal phosphate cyclase (ATP)
MIEVDGSLGEGGGAMVRVATALAAVTGNDLHLFNIRHGRPRSGLMPQHLHSVKAVAQLSQAEVEGLEIESNELFFYPQKIKGGNFRVDVGTAGSISLILQSFMIPAFRAKKPVKITIKGGTDVPWSPPLDYLENVTLPILEMMGCQANLKLLKRGFYPPGGGEVQMEIFPSQIKPLNLEELKIVRICGVSHASKLPLHIATRQKEVAERILKKEGYDVDIRIENSQNSLSPGTGLVLWTENGSRVGGSALGKRGKRAEKVGAEAANNLLKQINTGAPVDNYMADQIIPYMALAGDSRVKVSELSYHTLTNIEITKKITGADFKVEKAEDQTAIIFIT